MIAGLLHPLLVPAHISALLALGMLIGQQRAGGALVAFVAGAGVGLGALALAYVPAYVSEALLALAFATGALTAWARPLPPVAIFAVAAAMGAALGLDSPPEVLSIGEANAMLIGIGFGATIIVAAIAAVAWRSMRSWHSIGTRILGSWIAASAILALTLELAR